ncbi:sulfate transporter [Mycobacterium deserti]|uniref:Sulfate transporter n=1 Tax=Mycobacterium deserti TaxID=2978347 RepID=A0ABT2M9K8_9MYCO|nr:sulfate transporter [Mycobacterium deserti]MCT7658940.1 sulfate transporter [Mycobacterium deserti]
MTVGHHGRMRIAVRAHGAVAVLSVEGLLDSDTYRPLRDSIVKSALDEPAAVIVDVSALRIPELSACTVFTSAWWQVSQWPDVPILLVCSNIVRRERLWQAGIGHRTPIHPDVDTAADAVGTQARTRVRRRANVELLRHPASLDEAKDFVTECLREWSHPELITAAKLVAVELVRNALTHTDSTPSLRVESSGCLVTIAVDDECTRPALLREAALARRVSGLEIVAGLSRAWGSAPSTTGKTVWATIEPETDLQY